MTVKEEIQRLRAEARHFRVLAKHKRDDLARMKALPIIQRNPIAMLEAGLKRQEYVRTAQSRDQRINELRMACASCTKRDMDSCSKT